MELLSYSLISLLVSTVTALPSAVQGRATQPQQLLVGPSVVEVPQQFHNVFPAANFNRNVSVPMWLTSYNMTPAGPSSVSIQSASQMTTTLKQLADAHFLVYSKDFYKLLDIQDHTTSKTVEKIFQFPQAPSWANRQIHDGTVYSPECNCIFFVELHSPNKGYSNDPIPWVWRINLNGSIPVTEKVYPNPPLTVPNGAYYYKGSVYWAIEGNYTVPGGIVKMDPRTLTTQVVLNNYFGHRFNSPNDVVINSKGIAYFTDGYYGYDNFNDTIKPQLANGVWRWDMNTGNIKQVTGYVAGLFYNPNGVAFNDKETVLYITNRGNTSDDPWGGRSIYHFDVTDSGIKNGEVFAYTDSGFPDGVKTCKKGNVYGGVTGSVDVFNQQGTLIGKIKTDADDVAVNMQWVNDWLYIVARNFVYRVQLNSGNPQTY